MEIIGILQRATDAKKVTDKNQAIEQARIDILGKIAEKKGEDVTDTEVKAILNTYFEGVPSKLTDLNQVVTTKSGKYEVKLSELLNGVTVKSVVPKVSATDIKSAPDEFYGSEITNFTSENGYNQWKIFYADSSNIYIIASDYIEYTTNLKGKGGNSFIQGNSTYNYKFGTNASTGVMQDYPNGTDEMVDTTYATTQEIKSLNSKYFATFPEKRTENNKIAVVSMLDTTVWNGYMDKTDKTGKAKYAIGGPTIEMLFNSYNEKKNLFNDQNKGKYQVDVPINGNSGYGYNISTNYGVDWSNSFSGSSNYLDTTDTLYVSQNTNTNANGYWLASPGYMPDYLYTVRCTGDVSDWLYTRPHWGFRPLVCLKSDVELQKVENGKYKIAN